MLKIGLLAALALAGAVQTARAAASAEEARAGAELGFGAIPAWFSRSKSAPPAPAASRPAPADPAPPAPGAEPDPEAGAKVLEGLRARVTTPAPLPAAASAKGATVYVRLAPLRNGYWKGESVVLGGRPAWLSMIVNRGQTPFGAALGEKDAAAQFVGVGGLIRGKVRITVNGADYDAWLSPDLFDQLSSRVNLRGTASGDLQSVTLRDLIGATLAEGFAAPLGGQTYRVFYFDEIQPDGARGRLDASRQNVMLAVEDGGEFHFYVIPLDQVPDQGTAVFKLYQDRRVGVQRLEGGAVLGLIPDP